MKWEIQHRAYDYDEVATRFGLDLILKIVMGPDATDDIFEDVMWYAQMNDSMRADYNE